MNSTADHSRPQADAVAVTGPGSELSRVRIDRGLDCEEVARKLRLPVKLIEALERDDYSGLPGSTYIRGYLRAYAAMLGVPPEPVLEAHARLTRGNAPTNLGKLAVAEQVTSQHRHMRLTTYLVVAVIFGLSIAWWQARDVRRAGNEPATPVTASSAEELVDSPARDASVPGPEAAEQRAALPSEQATRRTPVIPEPRAEAKGSSVANLTVHAEQESWADIRDAEDRRLVYEILPAGRTVTLQGIPPFSIYLGNVAGVRVELNGEVQDTERFGPGPVARFRVGEGARPTVPRTSP